MLLGTLELTRREVDEFTGSTLLRAYRATAEPQRSLVLLAALALSVSGPPDWPTMRGGLDYVAYGDLVRSYLRARRVDVRRAVAAGLMAVEAVARQPGITDEEVASYADFFGVTPAGETDSGSPSDTSETPSEG